MPREAPSSARAPLRRSIAALLAGVLALCTPSIASADSSVLAPVVGSNRGAAVTLSNLRTLSRWAYPQAASAVHQRPSLRSRVVGRMRFLTPDGQAEVYLTLRSDTVNHLTWILVSVPGRPNGVTGWVPASELGELHVAREYLRVDRETLRAVLYRDGRPIWTAPVGVGATSSPTPAGHFYVTEKLRPLGDPFYGPYAVGTSAYSPTLTDWPGGGVVGIHGTDEPQLIPGRPSHGCIRLRNADVTRLWGLIEIGTPIEIV